MSKSKKGKGKRQTPTLPPYMRHNTGSPFPFDSPWGPSLLNFPPKNYEIIDFGAALGVLASVLLRRDKQI